MSLKDLAVKLNEVFMDNELSDFRIRDIITHTKTSKRHVGLDFESGFDAMAAQEKLDGFEFITSGGSCNILKAKILTDPAREEPTSSTEVVISTTSKDYYGPDWDSLEEQIELLRKQTLAMKAQRKFIREQKKLKKEYTSLDVDSESDSSESEKRRKRKRKRFKSSDSESSSDDYRAKSHDKQTRKSDRSKRSKSRNCDDYVSIEYKKVTAKRPTESPAPQTSRCTARSMSHEIPTRKPESYRKKSTSSSRDRNVSVEHSKSTKMRRTKSPSPHSSRRDVRPVSRERRSKSPEKYYSVEMIQYKKSLVTTKRSPVSRSRYESDRAHDMRRKSRSRCRSPNTKSSRRSSSAYRTDLRSKADLPRRKTPRRSRSKSPFELKLLAIESIDSIENRSKNRSPPLSKYVNCRSPSAVKITTSKRSPHKLGHSSVMLGHNQTTSKAREAKETRDHDEKINLAKMQSRKLQAMEDVLFEMELLLSREDSISSADKALLTHLVKDILNSRFQKLEVHDRMMISDLVTCYRSQYSVENDKDLLHSLAGECKSLNKTTSIVVADSTADVPAAQTQNDEIWTAVDEVLGGVDLHLLQEEPDTKEVVEVLKKDSKTCDVADRTSKITAEKEKHQNNVDTSSHTNNPTEKITSSVIALTTNTISPVLTNTIGSTEINYANCDKTSNKTQGIKVEHCVKIEPIELSDDTDNEINVHTTVSSTVSEEGNFLDNRVISLVEKEKSKQKDTPVVINKEKIATISLIDDDDEPASHIIDSTTDPTCTDRSTLQPNEELSQTNLVNSIKQEKTYTINLIDDNDIQIIDGPITQTLIKQENTAVDKEVVQDECILLPTPLFLTSIKQEPITTDRTSCSHSNDACVPSLNATLDSNILGSMKQEKDMSTVTHNLTSNIISDTVIPKPLSVKQEVIQFTDSEKHFERTDSNTDQINMPVPMISDFIKQECVATDAFNIAESNKSDINMPSPIVPSGIKQENDAIISDLNTENKKADINDTDQINIPLPMISSSIEVEKEVTVDNNTKANDIDTDINEQILVQDEQRVAISCKNNINNYQILTKQEKSVTVNNTPSQNVRSVSNNDKSDIGMPVPIDLNALKREHEKTDKKSRKEEKRRAKEERRRAREERRRMKKELRAIQELSSKQETRAKADEGTKQETKTIKELSSKQERKIKEENKNCKEKRHEYMTSKEDRRAKKETSSKDNRRGEEETNSKEYKRAKEDRRGKEERKAKEVRRYKDKHISIEDSEKYKWRPVNSTPKPAAKEYPASLKVKKSSNESEQKSVKSSTEKTDQTTETVKKVIPVNPRFIIPIYVIMKPMRKLIKNEFKDYKYLFHITHKVLMDRLKELLTGKDYQKANNIIRMYRERYAIENYKDFLKSIAADISTGKYDGDIRIIVMKQEEKAKKSAVLDNKYHQPVYTSS